MVTQELDKDIIGKHLQNQKRFFETGATLDLSFRLKQLKKLYKTIEVYEEEIIEALHKDFRKSPFEVYESEIALAQAEIKYLIKNLPRLMRPERVKSALVTFPIKSYVYKEPYGQSLIIGPWNYPFMLIFEPLAGSIAAGNCVVVKPSELSFHTGKVVRKIIEETFDELLVSVVEGGPEETQLLLEQQFDHIFFTGSEKVGRIVYEAAAKKLTPCILELGGKSPCIVTADANLDLAAKRITWGKLLNGGQSCVAPDYLLLEKGIKDKLLEKIVQRIKLQYGADPAESPDYPRIINDRNHQRLDSYLSNGRVVFGGASKKDENYIAPTILDNVKWSDPVMQEEIFGPILPAIEYDNIDEAIQKIREGAKPLALYLFTKSKKLEKKILREVSFGGGCINDTMMQFGSSTLPVGGVGNSGIGKYHGKDSFNAFSNSKGICKQTNLFDIPIRYAPYKGKLKWLKLAFKF